ncbi:MAG TPA: NAD(P)H-binding protein [Mucilaginibacter sp.]
MTVSILGCGWYGKALGKALAEDGITINGSVTSEEKLASLTEAGVRPFVIRLGVEEAKFDPDFFNCEMLIVSIPPKTRSGEGGEYLSKLKRVVEAIRQYKIGKVIYISSTGVYGEANCHLTEHDTAQPDSESGKVLLAAETLFKECTDFKTTVIRFAGLVGPGRHPGRFFAGKTDIPNGQAPVNLIGLDDCVGITKAIIKKDVFGITINAVCPHHPPKSEFYQNAAAQGGFTAPKFIDELNSWKIIDSGYISTLLDYEFSVVNWDIAEF